jgi:hypothetical protein
MVDRMPTKRSCIGHALITEGDITDIVRLSEVNRSGIVTIFEIAEQAENEFKTYFDLILSKFSTNDGQSYTHHHSLGIQKQKKDTLLDPWYQSTALPRLQGALETNQGLKLYIARLHWEIKDCGVNPEDKNRHELFLGRGTLYQEKGLWDDFQV